VRTPRPASAKGANSVKKIVRQGAEILLEEGLRAVNKRRIARALDISDGNVSYYFPTRESLWSAVLEYELEEYFRRFHSSFLGSEHPVQARFDDYVGKWVEEYEDRMVRVFFSQILTFGETEPLIAHYRDRVYRIFFEHLLGFAKELAPKADPDELQQRVLLVMSLLEGLHAVSAFRPDTIEGDTSLRERVVDYVNRIIKGESTS
jgi:AcrR family transcriptional regulator